MTVFIGLEAPEFNSPAVMTDGSINYDFALNDYRGKSRCVVFFYSMDFGQVDPSELIALNEAADRLKKLDTKIIAISTDTFLSHQMWLKIPAGKGGVGKLKFPLVADYTKVIAKGYDVIMNDTIAMRATFVLDNNGVVRHQSINDFPIGRNIEEIIRIIEAIEFSEKNERLSPANWQKGDNGIKYEDDFAREYLSKK